ncbi:glycosyltransferase family 2 protein [Gordonia bronchialis]|uniref:glycosyltransferase family 2 protein n=1 Tax=Gordonia bronchialis TaxID=2054 RepID=UPI00226E75C4|nr:glycosyltransferase [Gordonia bronchialis]
MSTESDVNVPSAVTVCIPLYNNAETLQRCLSSVLSQDYDDFEILVVDDRSTDNGVEIARELLRDSDRVLVNEHNLGAAGNHNRCIELARGELIQFVHGDDELLPGALSTLTASFADDVALAFAPRDVVTEDDKFMKTNGTLHHRFRDLGALNNGDDLLTYFVFKGALHNWIGEPTCVMFRRDYAVRVGGFRTDIAQNFDYDLWMNMAAGHQIAFVDQKLSVRYHTDTNLSALNLADRRGWLDRPRFLWSVALNSGMNVRARLFAAMWLTSAYPESMFSAVLFPRGRRWSHLREAATAPITERRRRRRLDAEYR